MVPARLRRMERFLPIVRDYLAVPRPQRACPQISICRIPKVLCDAPMRGRRRPGPEGIRIRCIKLFEPFIHAPNVMHLRFCVHADLRVVARALSNAAAAIVGDPVAAVEVNGIGGAPPEFPLPHKKVSGKGFVTRISTKIPPPPPAKSAWMSFRNPGKRTTTSPPMPRWRRGFRMFPG